MDNLSDDLLANILSRMSLKEAARTCVLAQRWKYLWRSGTLKFDSESLVTANRDVMAIYKFESLLDTLLEVHQDRCIEGIVISFEGMHHNFCWIHILSHSISTWMYAPWKQVGYEFPSVQMFSRLKTLRLVYVEIEDEAVNYFLASAPVLEEFCVSFSRVTKHLQVVDPPSLRSLEISICYSIKTVEISAANLVSLTYRGGKISLLLKKVPKLCKLSISDEFAASYVLEPKQDSSYISAQLVELVLDLHYPTSRTPIDVPPHLPRFTSLKRIKVLAFSAPGHSLRFFTLLVEASPQLVELSLEMRYKLYVCHRIYDRMIAFPSVWSCVRFDHKSLKVVEMVGFVGSQNEAELFIELFRNAPLIERVVIDTKSDYYQNSIITAGRWSDIGARTQTESKMRAKHLEQFCHSRIKFVIT